MAPSGQVQTLRKLALKMTDVVIYVEKTLEIRSILRDEDKDFKGIKNNKPLLKEEKMDDITQLGVVDIADPLAHEQIRQWLKR